MARFLTLFSAVLGAAAPASWAASAEAAPLPGNPNAYAVVVGSNPGGEGQGALRFAESDAVRVKAVLTELGRYDSSHVRLLTRPKPETILATLDELRGQLEAHRARGEDATLLFYYSGHARASAMNLGKDALELPALRERLTALPTALTIVVLDACQSGVFSRVKGAAPAADFSFNSVSSLNTRGLAVMASSSSTELSQESDRLGSSYFTHYLLVGLRGAGDQNKDGRVSLDEAYKYAYGQTLSATAKTAVGGQHVTLETELTGRGDVPMTYPSSSTSQVVLPKEFDGQVLLQNKSHRAVIAEVNKARGATISLAVPAADYEAIVRKSGKAFECKLAVGPNQTALLDLSGCSPVRDEGAQAKGFLPERRGEVWGFELGLGASTTTNDAYTDSLEAFTYRKKSFVFVEPPRWMLGISRRVTRSVALTARIRDLESRAFERDFLSNDNRTFDWSTYGLGFGVRGALELIENHVGGYGALELGPALGITSISEPHSDPKIDDTETFLGFHAAAAVGVQIMPWKDGGFFAEGNYTYAPVISNLLGDTHDSGGLAGFVGFRARSWGTL